MSKETEEILKREKVSRQQRHNLPGMENPLGEGNKGVRMTDLYSWDTEIS